MKCDGRVCNAHDRDLLQGQGQAGQQAHEQQDMGKSWPAHVALHRCGWHLLPAMKARCMLCSMARAVHLR